MTLFRERRSYAVPPPRRGRRFTLAEVLRREQHEPEPPTDAEVLAPIVAKPTVRHHGRYWRAGGPLTPDAS